MTEIKDRFSLYSVDGKARVELKNSKGKNRLRLPIHELFQITDAVKNEVGIGLERELEDLCERIEDASYGSLGVYEMVGAIRFLIDGHKAEDVDLGALEGDL